MAEFSGSYQQDQVDIDKHYMHEALVEAEKAARLGEVPIGAVIVCKGQIVGRGYNRRETDMDPTAHAEILAIQEASRNLGGWRLLDTTLYVTVEPCFMCAGAMVLARIERLVYGAKDPKLGAVDSLVNLVQFPGTNHQIEVSNGVCEVECRSIIQSFFQELRQRKKIQGLEGD